MGRAGGCMNEPTGEPPERWIRRPSSLASHALRPSSISVMQANTHDDDDHITASSVSELVTSVDQSVYLLQVYKYIVLKKYTPWCLTITLASVDRFSKFFYQLIPRKILYVYITKISTTPAICCCTTLWKLNIQNVADFDSILNKLLTWSWGHFEDLTEHLTVVRQTVSRLLTLSICRNSCLCVCIIITIINEYY